MRIDWNNKESKISKYFTVKEATYLPSFGCYHIPSESEKAEILKLAKKLDFLREKLNKPFIVHCWIRPIKINCPGSIHHGKNYNKFVGSKSMKSAHIFGKAVDFHVSTYHSAAQCSLIRSKILPFLEQLDLRMEDIEGTWIHLDTNPVKYRRFFKP